MLLKCCAMSHTIIPYIHSPNHANPEFAKVTPPDKSPTTKRNKHDHTPFLLSSIQSIPSPSHHIPDHVPSPRIAAHRSTRLRDARHASAFEHSPCFTYICPSHQSSCCSTCFHLSIFSLGLPHAPGYSSILHAKISLCFPRVSSGIFCRDTASRVITDTVNRRDTVLLLLPLLTSHIAVIRLRACSRIPQFAAILFSRGITDTAHRRDTAFRIIADTADCRNTPPRGSAHPSALLRDVRRVIPCRIVVLRIPRMPSHIAVVLRDVPRVSASSVTSPCYILLVLPHVSTCSAISILHVPHVSMFPASSVDFLYKPTHRLLFFAHVSLLFTCSLSFFPEAPCVPALVKNVRSDTPRAFAHFTDLRAFDLARHSVKSPVSDGRTHQHIPASGRGVLRPALYPGPTYLRVPSSTTPGSLSTHFILLPEPPCICQSLTLKLCVESRPARGDAHRGVPNHAFPLDFPCMLAHSADLRDTVLHVLAHIADRRITAPRALAPIANRRVTVPRALAPIAERCDNSPRIIAHFISSCRHPLLLHFAFPPVSISLQRSLSVVLPIFLDDLHTFLHFTPFCSNAVIIIIPVSQSAPLRILWVTQSIAWTPLSFHRMPFGVPTFPRVSTRLFVFLPLVVPVAVRSICRSPVTFPHLHPITRSIAWTPHSSHQTPFGVPTFPRVSTRLFVALSAAVFVTVLNFSRLSLSLPQPHRVTRSIAWTPYFPHQTSTGDPTFPRVSTRSFVILSVTAPVAVPNPRRLSVTLPSLYRATHFIAWTPYVPRQSPSEVPTFPRVSTRLGIISHIPNVSPFGVPVVPRVLMRLSVSSLSPKLCRLSSTIPHPHRSTNLVVWTPRSDFIRSPEPIDVLSKTSGLIPSDTSARARIPHAHLRRPFIPHCTLANCCLIAGTSAPIPVHPFHHSMSPVVYQQAHVFAESPRIPAHPRASIIIFAS